MQRRHAAIAFLAIMSSAQQPHKGLRCVWAGREHLLWRESAPASALPCKYCSSLPPPAITGQARTRTAHHAMGRQQENNRGGEGHHYTGTLCCMLRRSSCCCKNNVGALDIRLPSAHTSLTHTTTQFGCGKHTQAHHPGPTHRAGKVPHTGQGLAIHPSIPPPPPNTQKRGQAQPQYRGLLLQLLRCP